MVERRSALGTIVEHSRGRYAVTFSEPLLREIPMSRMSQLPTNPILAAPASVRIARIADRLYQQDSTSKPPWAPPFFPSSALTSR